MQVVGKIEAPTYKFTVQTEPTVNSLFQKTDPLIITSPHFDLRNIQVFNNNNNNNNNNKSISFIIQKIVAQTTKALEVSFKTFQEFMVTIVTFLTKVYFGFTSLPTSVTVNILTPHQL